MKTLICALALVAAAPSLAATVQIVCNGNRLDPMTGRQVSGALWTLAFEFDQQAQTMTLTEGGHGRTKMTQVSITDSSAKGVSEEGDWLFEINRIEGVATMRSVDAASKRLGLSGNYFKGTCAAAGQAKF